MSAGDPLEHDAAESGGEQDAAFDAEKLMNAQSLSRSDEQNGDTR